MPFTPFHMGPALLLKAATGRRFSVLVFGVSQVCIDLEPLVRILRGDPLLHGFTHTISGALVVGAGAALVAKAPATWFLRLLRSQYGEPWARDLLAADVSWGTAFLSAWIGTGSHLLLDGIMHSDMHPFAPLTTANPLLGAIGLGVLHLSCLVAGLVGAGLVVAIGVRRARLKSA